MMTRDEIAIKLAQITGRPIQEFLDVEEENEQHSRQNSEITSNVNSAENRNSDDDTNTELPHRIRPTQGFNSPTDKLVSKSLVKSCASCSYPLTILCRSSGVAL